MALDVTRRADAEPFATKDGSIIRELMHPDRHAARHQSLAEATLPPGASALLHRHHRTEEVYHILRGEGIMRLDGREMRVAPGDTVCIRPGVAHAIRNAGDEDLVLLCACAPPYAHDDTELLE